MKWLSNNEINRCLLCEDAPCSKVCPMNVDPAKRIRSLRFDNTYGAIQDMPSHFCDSCDKECEKACVLGKYTHSISIFDIMQEIKPIKDEAEADNPLYQASIRTDICGVPLENPFLLSSSAVTSNYEMCAKAFEQGWAGVVFKTICLFEQHETSPRFSVLKSGTGSFFGFKNIEQLSDHALEENMNIFQQLKKKYPNKVIVASIMGRNEQEWTYLAKRCDEAGADVIELNFSCPNMEDESMGMFIGQSEELIEKFTRASRRGTKKPILAKMTPNVMDMAPYAIAAKKGGADGIAAINTIKSITGVNIDTLTPEPAVHGHSAIGGYSGRAVKPIALRFIGELASEKELQDMHLSGIGGIESWKDALEFLLLGSSSVQVTTAVMQYGYRIVEDLISGLTGYMEIRNITSLKQLIGASIEGVVELDELERDTVLFPKFHLEKCIGCGRCYISCMDGGHQAIEFDFEKRKPRLNGQKCVGCHLCRFVCPMEAIGVASKRVKKVKG